MYKLLWILMVKIRFFALKHEGVFFRKYLQKEHPEKWEEILEATKAVNKSIEEMSSPRIKL